MGPLPIRSVRKKLKALGCTCEKVGASSWIVRREMSDEVITFKIEVEHGKYTKRDEVNPFYFKKIRNKLGITKDEWESA